MRFSVGDGQSGQTTKHCENHAFCERLAREFGAGCAESGADRNLGFARHGTDEHQVGEIGARNKKDEGGNPHKQMEAGLVRILHLLHPPAAGRQVQRLLRNQSLIAFLDLADGVEQKLAQFDLEVGFNLLQVCAWLDAANHVKPLEFGAVKNVEAAGLNQRRVVERKPESGGISGKAFAEEAGWRDTNYSEGLAVDNERGADHRRVLIEFLPPSAIADDGDWGRTLLIVRGLQ